MRKRRYLIEHFHEISGEWGYKVSGRSVHLHGNCLVTTTNYKTTSGEIVHVHYKYKRPDLDAARAAIYRTLRSYREA